MSAERNLIDLINSLVFYIDAEDPKFANWIEAEVQRIIIEGDSYRGKEYEEVENGEG